MVNNTLAPIALFVYKRTAVLRKTLESLAANEPATQSRLLVFADGPKHDASYEDKVAITQARSIVREKQWCGDVEVVESCQNLGLAKSITKGVTEVVNKYGKCIVLEDDLELSPHFLVYMNSALDMYESDAGVISISGYFYPIKKKLPTTFFLRGADCWGWATWKRGWNIFNPDANFLLNEIKAKRIEKAFNLENSYPYISMLQDHILGKIDSWAICWYASAFINNRLTLCPGKSLVRHIGNEGKGMHVGSGPNPVVDTDPSLIPVNIQRIKIKENLMARRILVAFFKQTRMRKASRLRAMLKRILPERITSALGRYLYKQNRIDYTANRIAFTGDYASWAQARANSTGYDSEIILRKTRDALLKVKHGEAAYERDSVIFDKIEYAWPLLAGLLWAASRHNNELNIADFGGSLGSTYFQNKAFFGTMKKVRWNIIEQPHVVKCGKEYFEDDIIKFYTTLEECLAKQKPHSILLSSVLQYLEKPYEFLENMVTLGFENIIIDRTLFNGRPADRLTVQKVPRWIYDASYPCWLFDKKHFCDVLKKQYSLLVEFDDILAGKGFIFTRING